MQNTIINAATGEATYTPLTQEQLNAINNYKPSQDEYADAIQKHIDATAQTRQYTDGISLASYDSSSNPTWAAEAQTFIAWRDQVWTYAFTELEKVKNGTRPQPSIEELLAELPSITWPQ